MAFELPDLPYDYKSLEPFIDKVTMHLHYDKHHSGYVAKLNSVLERKEELLGKSIEELLGNVGSIDQGIKQAVINFGGGHANHSLFWKIMSPKGGGEPTRDLAKAIDKSFGSFSNFKDEFTKKALSLFGSGWVFLMMKKDGSLTCKRHSFHNTPLMHGSIPLLVIDVWEHAYYLKYQNRRADYIKAWWNVVNWDEVEKITT